MAEQHIIEVQGMTCSGCEQRIHRSLELDGVHEVEADHQAGQVRVRFDRAAISPATIEGRIRDAGYTIPA